MAKQRKSLQEKLKNLQKSDFVGRVQQIQKFEQNLKLNPDDVSFLNIFNVHGQGGVGKTTLIKKFKSLCSSSDYTTVYIDCEDRSLYEATETMNVIAKSIDSEGKHFKTFFKRYKDYLHEKSSLEADPDKPKGTLGLLAKTGFKVGAYFGKEALPGGCMIHDALPMDQIASQMGEWANFAAKKISNKDNLDLVLHPLKNLTPIWIEDLYQIAEQKDIALFFDTFETSNPELDQWLFDLFKFKYGDIPPILCTISGRNPLNVDQWKDLSAIMHTIELEPFTDDEANEYLKQKGIANPDTIRSILSISGNLPVYLSLLTEGDPSNPGDICDPKDKVVERFLKHISDPLKRNLALSASIPNYIDQDVIECLLPEKEKANTKSYFEWINSRPFIQKRAGKWAFHPVAREPMLQYQKEISEQDWESLHKTLADWYEKKALKLQIEENKEDWLKDEQWRKLTSEKYFHLLCINYKQHIKSLIQDFVSIMLRVGVNEVKPLIDAVIHAEKLSNIKNGWGDILQNGIDSLFLDKKDSALVMFHHINNTNWIENPFEKSKMLIGQGFYESNIDNAINCFQKAIDINPNNDIAFYNMGVSYSKKGDYDKAIECYQKAIDINPNFDIALNAMGYAYSKKEDYDKAIECYQKAIDINPNFDIALNAMGYAYSKKEDYDKAIECYQKAIDINPNFDIALNAMGYVYSEKGVYEKAIEYYKKGIDINPNDDEAFYNMGNAYLKKGVYEKAIECYQKAIDINPNDDRAFNNMGTAYSKKGVYEKAIECYQKAIDINPNDDRAFTNIGWLYLTLLNYDKAITCFFKVLELTKQHEHAAMNLGHAFLLTEKKPEKALSWYHKSLPLWEEANEFFNGMESDFLELKMEEKGIAKNDFDTIIVELKKSIS